MFSTLYLNLPHAVNTFEPLKCKNCKHFIAHVGPIPPHKDTAGDLGKCKLLGYYATTCRSHWLSTISCGFEARFFEPKVNKHR